MLGLAALASLVPGVVADTAVACGIDEELTPAILYDNQSRNFSVVFAASQDSSLKLITKQYNQAFAPVMMRTPQFPPVDPYAVLLTPENRSQAHPSVVVVNGSYYVAYAVDGRTLVVRQYDATWAYLRAFSVTNDTSVQENDPSLAFDNDTFYLAYESFETGNWHIHLRTYDSGFTLKNTTLLTFTPNGELSPSLAVANNALFVAYRTYFQDDGYASVFVDEYDLSLALLRTSRVTSGVHALLPALHFQDNMFYVDYMAFVGNSYNIVERQYDENFTFQREVPVAGSRADEASPGVIREFGTQYHVYITNERSLNDVVVRVCGNSCVRPELTVDPLDYIADQSEGGLLQITSILNNTGLEYASGVNVSLFANGMFASSVIVDAPPNSSQNLSFYYTIPAGLTALTLVADPQNATLEENESNNEQALSYFAVNLSLAAGPNLVSVPVSLKNRSPDAVFAPLNGSLTTAFAYTPADPADPWKTFDFGAPAFANDLAAITADQGLWLVMGRAAELAVGGRLEEQPYALSAGWNLVGYPFSAPRDVQTVQNDSILRHRNATVLYAFNATTGSMRFYNPNDAASTLDQLAPGRGYWIYVPDSDADGLSDGEEEHEYFREQVLEAEDFSSWTAASRMQFGAILHSNWQIAPNYTLPLTIAADANYRLTTTGTAELAFAVNLNDPTFVGLCDFDLDQFARQAVLELLNVSVLDAAGQPVPAAAENKTWVSVGSAAEISVFFSDLRRIVTVISHWSYEGTFDLSSAPYTVRLALNPLPPKTVPQQIANLIASLNASNGELRLERQGLNQSVPDADNDTLPDGFEWGSLMYPLSTDPDRDGLSDPVEVFTTNTSPEYRDTDFDGLRDAVELGRNGADVDNLTAYDTDTANTDLDPATTTDPLNRDSDRDGLPDGWTDGWDYIRSFGFDARREGWTVLERPDTILNAPVQLHERVEGEDFDGDGLVDSGPWQNGTLFGAGETDPNTNDTDHDTLPDAWEAFWGLDPLNASGADGPDGDADMAEYPANETPAPDTLSNLAEYVAATNPRIPDSDGDGLPDGTEASMVAFRTNVPDGAHTIAWYGTLNASGSEEWVWFAGRRYVFDRDWTPASPNFLVSRSGRERFLYLRDPRNITLVGLLDDNTLISRNTSADTVWVCRSTCLVYRFSAPQAQNASPQLAFKGSEVYVSDPLRNDTDADAILDAAEPVGDPDGDGTYSARDYDADNDNIPDWYENTALRGATRAFAATDIDGDGLLDMADTDSDADGILDEKENPLERSNTSYTDPDTDNDGLLDGANITVSANLSGPEHYKLTFFFAHNISYANQTVTLTFWGEQALGTNASNPDTDTDLLYDGFSRFVGTGAQARLSRHGELSYRALPLNNDTDNDTLRDGVEVLGWPVLVRDVGGAQASGHGVADPTAQDTDGDGLNDSAEYLYTDANETDTDGDGLNDSVEDSNRNGQPDTGETSPVDRDSDADFLPDGAYDLDANGTINSGEYEDADNDGVRDAGETDPASPDSDRDGLPDGLEVRIVRFRTSAIGGNYSTPGSWVALDVGQASLVTFGPTSLNMSPYEPGALLPYTTPEGYPIAYNASGPALFLRAPSINYTLGRLAGLPEQTPTPNGAYGTREVYFRIGSNPLANDSDADELLDGQEFFNLSGFEEQYLLLLDVDNDGMIAPLDSDSDADGILDGNDLWRTTNKTVAPIYNASTAAYWERYWGNDFDGDSRANAFDTDSDADNQTDGQEDLNHDGRRQDGEGDPLSNDQDEDGLIDTLEPLFGLNASDPDSDKDGIKDGDEQGWNTDLDGDGSVNALDPDADGDGLLDGSNQTLNVSEPRYAYFATNHSVALVNVSNDTVLVLGEAGLGTKPYDTDSDSDGLWDGPDPSDVGNHTYAGKLTIGTVTLDLENIKGTAYYTDVLSTLPLHIYGELSHAADPLHNDTDADGLTDGDELNGYFLSEVPFECNRADTELELFMNEPGNYILSFTAEALNLNIGGQRSFWAQATDLNGTVTHTYSRQFEPQIFFPETLYYPYEPGVATSDGIAAVYNHDVPLTNSSAGPVTVTFGSPDAAIDKSPRLLRQGGLDPASNDTDADNLSDSAEVFGSIALSNYGPVKTVATNADTDGDGRPDSVDALPADVFTRENVDGDMDAVWDRVDRQPDAAVAATWSALHPPRMVFYNATYRVWGIGGDGCGDVPPWEVTKLATWPDCAKRFKTGDGYWKSLSGFHTSDLSLGSAKKAVKAQIIPEAGYVLTNLTFLSKRDPAIRAYPNPYGLYNTVGYFPAWKLYFELPDQLYNAEVENNESVTVTPVEVPFVYELTPVKVSSNQYQEFVFQFVPWEDFFFYFDEDTFNLPAISFTLYDTLGVARDNVIYRSMALAQPIDSPTCTNAYEARLKIPKEYATQTNMQLYLSPMYLRKRNGHLGKFPTTGMTIGSLAKQTLDYAYTIVASSRVNSTRLFNATPADISSYATGNYTFDGFSIYVYRHDGTSGFDGAQTALISANFPALDGIVLVSDVPGMVDRIKANISWTGDWYTQDNASVKAFTQYRVQRLRTYTYASLAALDDQVLVQSEPDMGIADGEVHAQIRRIDGENVSYEAGFSIRKVKSLTLDPESQNVIDGSLSVTSDAIEVGSSPFTALGEALEDGRLKDPWYSIALTHREDFFRLSKGAELAGSFLEIGSILATDGVDAYVAFRQNDTIKGTLHTVKGVLSGVKTVYDARGVWKDIKVGPQTKAQKELAEAAEASKQAKGLKAGVKKVPWLDIAVGAVDISLNVNDAAHAKDPIAKSFALEGVASSSVDLGLNLAGTAYPPLGIAKASFDLSTAAFSAVTPCQSPVGCNLGRKSLSEKIVLFSEMAAGIIPADVYAPGYAFAQTHLLGGEFKSGDLYLTARGYVDLYADESYLNAANEELYAQAVILPKP